MIRYENLTSTDKWAFLARLGNDILAERKRLAFELRVLLNERRIARKELKKDQNQNFTI